MLILSVNPTSRIQMGEDLVEVHTILDDSILVSVNDGPLIEVSYTPVKVVPNGIIKFFFKKKQYNEAKAGFSLPGKRIQRLNTR